MLTSGNDHSRSRFLMSACMSLSESSILADKKSKASHALNPEPTLADDRAKSVVP